MTHFHAQSVPDDVITRERLLHVLAPERNVQIRLLCTPAGFGKTILARQFSQKATDVQVIWIDLSAELALTPSILLSQITQALGLSPSNEETVFQALLTTPSTLLVLDDYQPNTECDAWLLRYIKKTHAQWLVTSRRRPEWPLSRLLLNGQLLSLESEHLALTIPELTAILELLSPQQNLVVFQKVC